MLTCTLRWNAITARLQDPRWDTLLTSKAGILSPAFSNPVLFPPYRVTSLGTTVPISQRGNLRLRKVTWLSWGHSDTKWLIYIQTQSYEFKLFVFSILSHCPPKLPWYMKIQRKTQISWNGQSNMFSKLSIFHSKKNQLHFSSFCIYIQAEQRSNHGGQKGLICHHYEDWWSARTADTE